MPRKVEESSDDGEDESKLNASQDESDDLGEDFYEDDDDDDDEDEMVEIKAKALDIGADGSLSEDLLVRREGWIWKKGGAVNQRSAGRKNWKKRWFVLKEINFRGQIGYEMKYYDRPKGFLKGTVGLSEVSIFCESTRSMQKKKGSKARVNTLLKYEFQLLLPHGSALYLSCDDPVEREEWIETLNVVIAYLRLLTHPELAMVVNGYDPMNEDDEDVYHQGDEVASNCQAYGPGLFGSEAGQQGQFVLEIHDIEGQPVERGGMPVTCTISNDDCVFYVTVLDNQNGTYSGFYTIATPGKYKLHLRLNDEHDVFGSPYDIEILPSKTVAECSTVEGECLTQIYPGIRSEFVVVARDSYGNKKARGGDQFEVSIMGPAQLMSVEDNSDGTYTCVLEAQDPTALNYYAAGSLMINVTLHGKTAAGSPFRPIILDAAQAPAGSEGVMRAAMDSAATQPGEPRRQSIRASVGGGEPVAEEEPVPEPTAEEVALQIAQENFLRQQAEAEQMMDAREGGSTASKLERARARAKMAKAMLTESSLPAPPPSDSATGSRRGSKRGSVK